MDCQKDPIVIGGEKCHDLEALDCPNDKIADCIPPATGANDLAWHSNRSILEDYEIFEGLIESLVHTGKREWIETDSDPVQSAVGSDRTTSQ